MYRRVHTTQFFPIFMLVLGCFAVVCAQRDGKIIEMVDVQGNRRLSDDEIMKSIETRSGQRLDPERVKADLQNLRELGQFDIESVRAIVHSGSKGGVDVVFEVRELPLMAEVRFDGLKYLTPDELRTYLESRQAEVLPNTPYDPLRMRKAHKLITEYLSSRGYKEAKVTVLEEEKSWAAVVITILIDEMPGDEDVDDSES